MSSTLIYNIGAVVSGDLTAPVVGVDSVYLEDGLIREVGTDRVDADTVIDANGLTLTPGLVDGHTHPVFGDYSPTQNSVGWMSTYLHGGTTTIVSAGELHLPGLPLDRPDPKLFRDLAVLVHRCFEDYRPGGLRVVGGTMLLTPGMKEEDFDVLAGEGCRVVKFIFFPYDKALEEGVAYAEWARARGLTVKIHSGGVSRSGLSAPAGANEIKALRPNVVGHVSGGPIPMSFEDVQSVVAESDGYLEIAYAGNPRWSVQVVEGLREQGALGRITVGTDTPSGTGTTPRGMLRTILLISSLGGVPPAEALCLATGNTAKAHGLQTGLVQPGYPADLLLMGRITGSNGKNALDAISLGDLPGISTVLVGGELAVRERSQQTPPPEQLARIVKDGSRQ